MTMIVVMFKILIFGFCFVLVTSLLLSIIITIYNFPYYWWLGGQNCAGRYKHLKNEKLWSSCKHATKLYIAFFSRKEPML